MLPGAPQGYDYYDDLKGQGPYYNPPMITAGENGEPVTRKHTDVSRTGEEWATMAVIDKTGKIGCENAHYRFFESSARVFPLHFYGLSG